MQGGSQSEVKNSAGHRRADRGRAYRQQQPVHRPFLRAHFLAIGQVQGPAIVAEEVDLPPPLSAAANVSLVYCLHVPQVSPPSLEQSQDVLLDALLPAQGEARGSHENTAA